MTPPEAGRRDGTASPSEDDEAAEPTLHLLLVGGAALALVLLSYLLTLLEPGRWSTPAALGIGTTKAVLILWFFMEVHGATTSIRVSLLAALLLVGLLIGLTVTDVGSRVPPPLLPPTQVEGR